MAKPPPTQQMADSDDDKSWDELSDDERNAFDEVILSALVDKKDIRTALIAHVQTLNGVSKHWITNRWVHEHTTTAEFQKKVAPVLSRAQLYARLVADFALIDAIVSLEKKDTKMLGDLVAALPSPDPVDIDDETFRKIVSDLRSRHFAWKLDRLINEE